jgi:WXG100 family type VII secretion target
MNADQAAIDRKVQEFKDAHDIIDASLKALQTEADTLTSDAVWRGAAKDAFRSLMDSYSQHAQKMNNDLMDTADKLRTMSHRFDNHDQQNASKVQQIMGSLNLPPIS